jgi:hypothetical protein
MKNINYCLMICLLAIVCLIPKGIVAQEGPKEATEWTIKANQAVLADPVLNWGKLIAIDF